MRSPTSSHPEKPLSRRVLLSWSSGKDSAWALHELRRQQIDVVGLLTTFHEAADRVAMHAVRSSLVTRQAEAIGLPLWPVGLPWPCSNDEYERRMAKLEQRLSELHAKIDQRTAELAARFEQRLAQMETRLTRRMFNLWIAQAATTAGLVFAVVKLVL